MRLAGYVPENTTQTECVVTVLAGDAGGVTANINRWAGQAGHAPLSDAEIAALPRLEMLGTQAVLFQAEALDDGDHFHFIGVICPMPGHTLFVRMTGPSFEVKPETERFLAFCKSFYIEETPSQ